MMNKEFERAIGVMKEKLELLTGERANGARRAVLISELENAFRVTTETANRLDGIRKQQADAQLDALNAQLTLAINQARAEFDTAIDEISASVAENSAASAQMFADINDSIDAANALIATANSTIQANAAAAEQSFTEVDTNLEDARALIRSNRSALEAAIGDINDVRQLSPVVERVVNYQEFVTGIRGVAGVSASLEEFRLSQVTTNSAIAGQLTNIEANLNNATAQISSESTARVTADEALSTRIDNLVVQSGSGTAAAVDQEAIARIAGDNALAAQITTLTATVNANDTTVKALVTQEAVARVDADTALTGQITTLTATVNSNTAAIQSEATARTTADNALAAQITTLQAAVDNGTGTNASQISALQAAVADIKSSTATRTDNVTAVYGLAADKNEVSDFLEAVNRGVSVKEAARKAAIAAAGVQTNSAAITNTNESLASLETTVFARFGTTDATIQQQAVTMANADLALSARIGTLEASVTTPTGTGILARLVTEEVTRAQADFALTGRVTTLESSVTNPNSPGGILARLIIEEGARANADSALTSRVTTLESSVTNPNQTGGILARIVTEETARANADSALSTRVSAVESSVTNTTGSGVLARLVTEEAARASADNALSGRISTVEASITNTTGSGVLARLITEEATRANADTALSGRVTTLESSVTNPNQSGGLLARIVAEEYARASADNTIAANVNTLTTTVNGNTTSIQTLTASYNGIAAKYGVTVNENGYVSGFSLLSGAGTSEFAIQADKFKIAFPGAAPRQVMNVQSINGTPTLTFDGNIIATGTVNTAQIALNSVTNTAFASKAGAPARSGNASLFCKAGSTLIVRGSYAGGDSLLFGGGYQMQIYINGSEAFKVQIPTSVESGSTRNYYSCYASLSSYIGSDQTVNAEVIISNSSFLGLVSVEMTSFVR